MAELYYVGSTSQTIDLFIQDSTSTTGGGLTGLAYNTSGLTAYYRKGATGTATAITLATQTVGGAWSSGGFVEIDATNKPGEYRFDIPDALLDTEGLATITFRGAANMVACRVRIDCRSVRSDVRKLLGTAWLTPAVAGTPDVNVVGMRIVGPVSVGSTGNDTTHVHLPSLTFADDAINRYLLTIIDTTTGLRYSTWVTDWVASTALATVDTLPFTPANDDFVWIQAIRRDVDVVKVNGADAQGSGTPDVNLKQIDGSTSLVDVLKLFISVLNQSTGQLDAGSLADNTITAASLAADAGAELAALVETYIVNEGDATAVMQAIADKIAADWVAGDASPLAIVAAMLANATISTALGRLDAAVSTRASQTSVDNVQTEMNKVPRAAASVTPGGPFSRTNAGNAQTVSETFDGDT